MEGALADGSVYIFASLLTYSNTNGKEALTTHGYTIACGNIILSYYNCIKETWKGLDIVAESKPWDSTLKRLIQINPTTFVKWLVPGAVFIKERPHELENQKREVDALLEIFIE